MRIAPAVVVILSGVVAALHIGKMPPHLAAMQQTNINVQSLVVEAALTRKREHIYHAASAVFCL